MEKHRVSREMEAISGLFLSTDPGSPKPPYSEQDPEPRPTGAVEVEEVVTVRRRMVFPDERPSREAMKRAVLDLVEEGYVLTRVDLRKSTDVLEPGKRMSRKEELTLRLKEE